MSLTGESSVTFLILPMTSDKAFLLVYYDIFPAVSYNKVKAEVSLYTHGIFSFFIEDRHVI